VLNVEEREIEKKIKEIMEKIEVGGGGKKKKKEKQRGGERRGRRGRETWEV